MSEIPDYQLRVLEKEEITCRDVRDLMCDYADNEILPTLKSRIDEHFESCNRCRYFSQTYLKTIQLANELPAKELDSGAQDRLRKALNQRLGLNLAQVSEREDQIDS